MYKCRECKRTFDYPDYVERCMEDYYGVSGMFPNRTYATFAECPYCGMPIDTEEDEAAEEDIDDFDA